MSLNQVKITISFLQDEIALAKRIRSPLFDIDELKDSKAKYIEEVAKKIVKCANKHSIDTFFLAKLFIKYAFPFSTSHIPVHTLNASWSRFIETVFDEECLTLCKLNTSDAQVDENLTLFFSNWNTLAASLEKAYKAGASTVFLDKASGRDMKPYKTALKIYHFIRPHTILSSVFGDIITDKTALYSFIKACVDTKRIFQAKAVMAFLVKKDGASSKFFVESMEREYINIHKDDPSMKMKDLREVAPAPDIKRDTEAINKIRDKQ